MVSTDGNVHDPERHANNGVKDYRIVKALLRMLWF